jgi:DNA invertase Pin-like site-specific DNA recombinase
MSATTTRTPVLTPYARTSDPIQRKGGGLERQTRADTLSFCKKYGFKLSQTVLVDDGVSAFRGLHLSPEHELGKFLADVERGVVLPGDCLLIENWDRLSRQNIWAAIGLVNDLRQHGIHVGRLDRGTLLRCDDDDPGSFFEAAVELMRGNSESKMKSFRNGKEWAEKRKRARNGEEPLTHRLPAWIEEVDGELQLIPERAAAIKRIFELAHTCGGSLIVKRLTVEKFAPFGERVPALDKDGNPELHKKGRQKGRPRYQAAPGKLLGAGHWTRSYINLILKDRRVLGELQPRLRDGTPEGKPIKIPAVVTEAEFLAARAGAAQRKNKRGRLPKESVNVFSGLLKNAREKNDSYFITSRTERGAPPRRIILNTSSVEGRAPAYSFPFAVFQAAFLELLQEIDPHDILNGDEGPVEALALSRDLAAVEGKLAELEKELLEGNVAILAKVARDLEAKKVKLASALAEARENAAHPLSESWGVAQSLASAVEGEGPDQEDRKLRLRSALRRIIDSIWILVVPRGRDRILVAQAWFADGKRCRDFIILHRPPKANASAKTAGGWWAKSLASVVKPGVLDLRHREDADELERALMALDAEKLAACMERKGQRR